MDTDKYTVVRWFLNKQIHPFAIESIHCCHGYTTVYLSWNTWIYNYNLARKSHREAHKIRSCSPVVFNAIFNNISVISWWSVLLVEETGVLRENHRSACMDTDKYTVVRWFLNKQIHLFAIESIHFCHGYTTVCLSWNTCIYNYNLDGKIHREVHKVRNCSHELSSWEIVRNVSWCL
jgi:hypothetical protein